MDVWVLWCSGGGVRVVEVDWGSVWGKEWGVGVIS